jgi:threonine aldolase
MFFASDNGAPILPQVMEAMTRANHGYALSYGNDAAYGQMRDQIRDLFEAPLAEIALASTGTAANALALSLLTPPWGSVYCHSLAHIAVDECGAPEFFTHGAKLQLIDGPHGRIAPEVLRNVLATADRSVQAVQPSALSLSNVTELGTIYTAAEIAALASIAHLHGLRVHLDGARFSNALAATGASPAEMTWRAGVDVLTLGGTKHGLFAAEIIVVFDPENARDLPYRLKRGGQTGSKLRFVAAQIQTWLNDGLWLETAQHCNDMAASLAEGLHQIEGVEILDPVEANIIFARLPQAAFARAKAAGAVFYGNPQQSRFVSSWSTTQADVDALLAALRG